MNGEGPHLQVAAVCDRVLQEQDGTISAIRIIDRATFVAGDDGRPVEGRQPVVFLIAFKSGAARGRFTVELLREKPSGEQGPVLQAPVFFEGEDRGVNLILNAIFEPDQEGLYWYDVLFEGERVTRIPLRAIFQPMPTAGPGG
jgi:hypothetical protein